jgi:hypothetical protein
MSKNMQTINSIGVNSIKNIMMPQLFTTTSIKTTLPTKAANNEAVTEQIRKIDSDSEQEMLFNLQTAKITQLFTEFKKLSTKLSSHSDEQSTATTTTTTSTKSQLNVPSHLTINSNDFKFNTTVLAGIISGIGLVIVLINLVVLFLCRRNLKNFLKSSTSSSSAASSSSSTSSSSASSSSSLSLSKNLKINRDDLIQEYFEAFNTLHNPVVAASTNKKTLKLLESGGGAACNSNQNLPLALMNTIHRLQQQSAKNNNNSSNSGDESAKLFYNQSDLLTSVQSQIMHKDTILKRQLLHHLQQQQQQQNHDLHQYDKMNHQIVHKDEDPTSSDDAMGQSQQQHYAHTYECLDNLEMITNTSNLTKRPNGIHLGVSSRISQRGGVGAPPPSYRPHNNNGDIINSFLNDTTQNTTNQTDIANFNISSSSTSSSSGVSSTHQFITSNKNNNNSKTNQFHIQQQQQQQQQSPLTNFLLNSTVNVNPTNNNVKFLQNSQNSQQYLQFNGDLINVSNVGTNGGTWSPDSAYYSAIPTLNSYNFNLPQQQHQQQQHQFTNQQLQQFVNSHHNINSSLVDAGYNSQLV